MKVFAWPMFVAVVGCQSAQERDFAVGDAKSEAATEESAESPSAGNPNSFVGLSEDQAVEAAGKLGVRCRVVERDGELFPTTRDFIPDRLNFVIKGGVVTRVTTG